MSRVSHGDEIPLTTIKARRSHSKGRTRPGRTLTETENRAPNKMLKDEGKLAIAQLSKKLHEIKREEKLMEQEFHLPRTRMSTYSTSSSSGSNYNEDRILKLTEEKNNLTNKLNTTKATLEGAKNKISQLETELLDAHRALGAGGPGPLPAREQHLEKKIKALENKLEAAILKNNKSTAQITRLQDNVLHLEKERDNWDQESTKLNKEIEKKERECEKLRELLAGANQSTGEYSEEISALMTRFEREKEVWKKEMKQMKEQLHRQVNLSEALGASASMGSVKRSSSSRMSTTTPQLSARSESIVSLGTARSSITEPTTDPTTTHESENGDGAGGLTDEVIEDIERLLVLTGTEDLTSAVTAVASVLSKNAGGQKNVPATQKADVSVNDDADEDQATLERDLLDDVKASIRRMLEKAVTEDDYEFEEVTATGITDFNLVRNLGVIERKLDAVTQGSENTK